jgi:prepilin-type N-terminal cleavage/methylation domain-containing protein
MSSISKRAAFTLIELLVVISIILIATSILFVGGGGGGDGVKLSSAQRVVSSMAQGVRGQALLKAQRARLIIYSESNAEEPDKMLRFFGIIYEDPDNGNQWLAATQGTSLPEGIYFDPDLSEDNNWPGGATMNLEYPRQSSQPVENGPQYYYYEFNPNGTMASGFENSWMVLRAGTLKPDGSGELAVSFDEEAKANLKSALIFRRVGSTTLVTDPEEINP